MRIKQVVLDGPDRVSRQLEASDVAIAVGDAVQVFPPVSDQYISFVHGPAGGRPGICDVLLRSVAIWRLPFLGTPNDEQYPADDGNEGQKLKPAASICIVEPSCRHCKVWQQRGYGEYAG